MLKPIVFIPITVIAVIIEIKAIFGKKYSLDIYEVKEIYTIGLFLMLPGKKNMVQVYLWQALMSLIQEIRIMHIILMRCINLKE